MNIFQKIFYEHYDEVMNLNIRDTVSYNISRMLSCKDPELGGVLYTCFDCFKFKYVPYTCKSRFCPSCGLNYTRDRTMSITSKIINLEHKHTVFTIPDSLRIYFYRDRKLLDILFSAVNIVVSKMFNRNANSIKYYPSFICVLHTFGRDLKWNPHIHALISEGSFSPNTNKWYIKKYFDFKYLRLAFQAVLLKLMYKSIGKRFKYVKRKCFNKYKDGFYVNTKDTKDGIKHSIKYIGRYLGRPVIALSRIDKYDGVNVTFHYNRHEDDQYIEETLPAIEFIKRVIIHIPEKNFKQIRYFGLYALHDNRITKLKHLITKEEVKVYNRERKYRQNIIKTFGYDPIICPTCNCEMCAIAKYDKYTIFNLQNKKNRLLLFKKQTFLNSIVLKLNDSY